MYSWETIKWKQPYPLFRFNSNYIYAHSSTTYLNICIDNLTADQSMIYIYINIPFMS